MPVIHISMICTLDYCKKSSMIYFLWDDIFDEHFKFFVCFLRGKKRWGFELATEFFTKCHTGARRGNYFYYIDTWCCNYIFCNFPLDILFSLGCIVLIKHLIVLFAFSSVRKQLFHLAKNSTRINFGWMAGTSYSL